jgi:hypothetical protein
MNYPLSGEIAVGIATIHGYNLDAIHRLCGDETDANTLYNASEANSSLQKNIAFDPF